MRPIVQLELAEQIAGLNAAVQSDKVRHIGVSLMAGSQQGDYSLV